MVFRSLGQREPLPANAPTSTNGSILHAWFAHVIDAKPDRFKTLWFDDNLDGKIQDESAARLVVGADQGATTPVTFAAMHDLYDDNSVNTNAEMLWPIPHRRRRRPRLWGLRQG